MRQARKLRDRDWKAVIKSEVCTVAPHKTPSGILEDAPNHPHTPPYDGNSGPWWGTSVLGGFGSLRIRTCRNHKCQT